MRKLISMIFIGLLPSTSATSVVCQNSSNNYLEYKEYISNFLLNSTRYDINALMKNINNSIFPSTSFLTLDRINSLDFIKEKNSILEYNCNLKIDFLIPSKESRDQTFLIDINKINYNISYPGFNSLQIMNLGNLHDSGADINFDKYLLNNNNQELKRIIKIENNILNITNDIMPRNKNAIDISRTSNSIKYIHHNIYNVSTTIAYYTVEGNELAFTFYSFWDGKNTLTIPDLITKQ